MDRRQALKSIVLVPLSLHFLGGAIIPEVPELVWYQTPYCDEQHKIGLKATWSNGEKFGYIAILRNVPRMKVSQTGVFTVFAENVHPAYKIVKAKLTKMALAKVVYPPDYFTPPIEKFPVSTVLVI